MYVKVHYEILHACKPLLLFPFPIIYILCIFWYFIINKTLEFSVHVSVVDACGAYSSIAMSEASDK